VGEILFVDDDRDALDMYTKAVSLGDHRALVAADARQAWQKIRGSELDLIFVDINLPGVSGLQLLRDIADDEAARSIPIVILSAVPETELDQEMLRDADLFLSKPVSLQKLLSVIDRYQSR